MPLYTLYPPLVPIFVQVYVAPYQWSFPLNLPPQFFGIFPAGEIREGQEMPWSDEIDHKLFLPPPIGERTKRTGPAYMRLWGSAGHAMLCWFVVPKALVH